MSSAPGPSLTEESETSPSTAIASPETLALTSVPITTTSADGSGETFPPMTTPWSVPSSCTWTYDPHQKLEPGTYGPIAYLDLEPVSDASTVSCYPDGMFFDGRTGSFSPGTCPNGWTTVSVRQNTNEAEDDATTTAVCCSSEYTLDGKYCKREVPTVLAVPIVYNTTDNTHDVLTDQTSTLLSATLAVYAINALFGEEDCELLGLTNEDEILDEHHSRGLSLGSRIGIGIGAAMGGLLIGLGLWFIFYWRRSKQSKRRGFENSNTADDQSASAYDLSRSSSIVGDSEIEALRAQKAAIQRRIEELERIETNDHDRV